LDGNRGPGSLTGRANALTGRATVAKMPPPVTAEAQEPDPRVGAHGVRHLLSVLAADGIDVRPLRRAAGLDTLSGPYPRIPVRRAAAAWTEAVRLTGDEALGLHVAARLARGSLGALEYAVRHSSTVRQGLGQVVRYGRLAHDHAAFELVETPGEARLELQLPGAPALLPQSAQFFLGAVLGLLRDCTAGALRAREVWLAHEDPGNGDEYQRCLEATVRFAQPTRAIVLAPADLALPFREPDPALGEIVERDLERALEALPPVLTLAAAVRRLLAASLSTGEVESATVARGLGLSVRTLNRRLAAEGQSLKALRDEVRKELAVAWLRDTSREIADVAFLLGFSESSAFHRWFRRVQGATPGEFRRAATA
jgi:AraC-like DNA-binding protein